jgi:hypothetical protein
MTFRPVPKPSAKDRVARKIERAVERRVAKIKAKRDEDERTREALKAEKLLPKTPVKPKREGPPRKGTVIDEPYRTWVRGQGCVLRGRWCHDEAKSPDLQDSYHVCWGPIEFHHVKTRGAGGKDRGNGVGLCTTGHRTFHDLGRATFAARYAIDLAHVARNLAAAYLQGAP